MTEFRKQSDGSLLVGESAFRAQFPNVSIPKPLTEENVNSLGYDWVFDGAQPTLTPPYDSSIRDGVEQISSKWYTKFSKSTATGDAKTAIDNNAAAGKRSERDQLLKDSDWTQTADKGGLADSKVTEWATYRQALRDLPTATGWPHDVTWPTKPS
tara:strand:- start:68 stop:532 length:465 start_codon:yes stop_codon:yes gene_type:complete